MPFLSFFAKKAKAKVKGKVQTDADRSRPVSSRSNDSFEDYVLPPIPSHLDPDSWPDSHIIRTQSIPQNTSQTLRLVSTFAPSADLPKPSSPPHSPRSAVYSTLPPLPLPATAPRSKRPSLLPWVNNKSKPKASSDSIHPNNPESNDIHSFNLKSFRHVAPPPEFSPMALPSTPSPLCAIAIQPKNTGFQVTSRPRENSIHSVADSPTSQTVTASAFRQAARRSVTNLVPLPADDSNDTSSPLVLTPIDPRSGSLSPLPPLVQSLNPSNSANRPPSFRSSTEDMRPDLVKSVQNTTPLHSITGATRRYSGTLSSGPDIKHSQQNTQVAPSNRPKQQLSKLSAPSSSSGSSYSNKTGKTIDLNSNLPTEDATRTTKSHSEVGHNALQRSIPPSVRRDMNAPLAKPQAIPNSRNSFYGRQRASLSTGALSTGAVKAQHSTFSPTNPGISGKGKGKGIASWHDESDTSEEDESDSESSEDTMPLVTYMAKSSGSLVGEPTVDSRPNSSRLSSHRKHTLVDLDAPSTFHTADNLRTQRTASSMARNPSAPSSRSVEDLSSTKSYAGPMNPMKAPGLVASNNQRPSQSNRHPPVIRGVRNSVNSVTMARQDLLGVRATALPAAKLFRDSPTSSTSNGGDSSSGIIPATPRDGSDVSTRRPEGLRTAHRKTSSVTFADEVCVKGKPTEVQPSRNQVEIREEITRRDRRRSEARNAIELGNIVNGSIPVMESDEEVLGNGSLNLSGMNSLPSSPSDIWSSWARQSVLNPMPMPHQYMMPRPALGADPHFLLAHQQAMIIAKQTYQIAVAQQAMAAAGEEWERNSSVSTIPGWGANTMMFPSTTNSVYAGSIIGGSSSYGGNWGSRSVYGESFGPSLPNQPFPASAPPPSSFKRNTPNEGVARLRTRSGAATEAPPSSWKKR